MSHFNVIDRKFIYWTQSCQIFNIVHVTFERERKLKSIFEWVWNVCVAGIVVMTFPNLLLGTWKENIAYRFLMKILIESIFVCIHKREREKNDCRGRRKIWILSTCWWHSYKLNKIEEIFLPRCLMNVVFK